MICCIVYIFLLISLTGAAESGIVGGREAKPHSRPYMASVQYQGDHKCGGILIQRDFVLTAAHCKIYETYAVALGAHDITEEEKSQQHIEVAEYYPHPGFTGQYEYDIMLLKLKKKATLNKYVKTIGLPKRNGKTSANMDCVVAGWGWTTARDCPSNVLKEATESIESTSKCENIWQQYFNSDHMICTNFTKQSGGVCQGDSGGPLICKKKLQGITAYTSAEDCNDPKYPHVFTKVSVFIPWIKETMKK